MASILHMIMKNWKSDFSGETKDNYFRVIDSDNSHFHQ